MSEPMQHNVPQPQLTYHIRLKGHLDQGWSAWFDGMSIVNEASGECVLTGLVVDQAALHGLLIKIRDLGLTLLNVNHID